MELNGELLYPTDSVKYLGIKIDENLACCHQMDNKAAKLNRANALMSKTRHFSDFKTLKSIYYPRFESHLNYHLLVWAQNADSIKRRLVLQKTPLD